MKVPKLKQVQHTPGNCYEDCLNILLDNQNKKTIRLVHGYPKLRRGEHRGKRYGHAWIEIQELEFGLICVIDHVMQDSPVERSAYYYLGKILESQLTRYTPLEAAKLCLEHNHAGPFNKIPKGVLFLDTLGQIVKSSTSSRKESQNAQSSRRKSSAH